MYVLFAHDNLGQVLIITICSDSVIYFQICNPYRAAFGISDLRQALTERAQTTLRHVVGARAVQSVVTEREAIAFEIAEIVVCPFPSIISDNDAHLNPLTGGRR